MTDTGTKIKSVDADRKGCKNVEKEKEVGAGEENDLQRREYGGVAHVSY